MAIYFQPLSQISKVDGHVKNNQAEISVQQSSSTANILDRERFSVMKCQE